MIFQTDLWLHGASMLTCHVLILPAEFSYWKPNKQQCAWAPETKRLATLFPEQPI